MRKGEADGSHCTVGPRPALRALGVAYTGARMLPTRRLPPSVLGGLGIAALLFPEGASAHGIVGKADLPIPVWLFSWTAAIVLVVSFVALSTLWTRPQLQSEHRTRLFRMPAPFARLASVFGVGLFVLVVYAGFAGAQVPNANFSITLRT